MRNPDDGPMLANLTLCVIVMALVVFGITLIF